MNARCCRVYWHQYWSPLVRNQDYDELRWFCGACVPANGMNILWPFIKALARLERNFLSAIQLHHDRAFQHVNERMRIVPMNRIRRTGRIDHSDHLNFLTGKVWKIFRHDRCDLSFLRE